MPVYGRSMQGEPKKSKCIRYIFTMFCPKRLEIVIFYRKSFFVKEKCDVLRTFSIYLKIIFFHITIYYILKDNPCPENNACFADEDACDGKHPCTELPARCVGKFNR